MKRGVDFCPCVYGKEGYQQHPDVPYEFFVHSVCMLPTRQYLESVMLRDAIAEAWEEMDAIMDRLMMEGAQAEDGHDVARAEQTAKALVWMGQGKTMNHIRAAALERYESRKIQAEIPLDKEEEKVDA
jgi:hypothetical protein